MVIIYFDVSSDVMTSLDVTVESSFMNFKVVLTFVLH